MKPVSPGTLRNAVVVFIVVGILFLAVSGFLRPILGVVMDPFVAAQRWLSERFMAVYDFFTLPRDVTALIQRNNELEDEVANLQSQIIQLQQQLREADILYSLLDYARSRPADQYIAAAVIGRDPSPFLQYIIIDHGSDDGVRYGMPVVTQQGLVGRIEAVTASASRVQLISDSGSTVNVTLQNQNADALVQGSITGDITLEMLNQNVNLNVGDILLTSGLGGNYPSDILVGQVVDIKKTENELFQSAYVQPMVDFKTLRAVLVIKNFQTTNISPLTSGTTMQ
ncbi:MAG: rod shape-determining protein MreC [Anaerolineae bacterium]|jgi:rod shape-determining protein MreC|nr:rod shape-determining protein MreC [Anaerolineae bacterium]